ncbi:hypothetical protein [Stenomitos frigidus]|uniref:Uncharacterized protein n=1 Tax=Stenomitos frigidus ULC18 TaxID=2107698 RepID=A0A2T1EGQ1_9CYAN|nr:hypothetical protein [Stenomitos frigidus]PSB31937.1 hypothetical protein C7B82_06910 [Stenomitos frigidus ULC18]
MHILDDVTLIQQFISGEATLLANQKLRIEPAFNSVQLLANRGGLIATMKQVGSRQTILLRQASDYSNIVRQILIARQFVPVAGAVDQPGFEQYCADEIPAGYEANHTSAIALWKEWWRTARQQSAHGIHMDILIFARDTWYPIRNIVCSQGVLFITTLVSEVSFQSHEQFTWLRRLPASRPGDPPPLASPVPARSLQPLSRSPQPTIAHQERPTASTSPDFLSKRDALGSSARSDLKQVLRFRQGKLYVTTALGDIVVEGSHLKFRLEDEPLALDSQKPIKLNGYRDREGQAVNQ